MKERGREGETDGDSAGIETNGTRSEKANSGTIKSQILPQTDKPQFLEA